MEERVLLCLISSVRDAGNTATEAIEKYEIEKSFRQDIYNLALR